VHSHPTNEHIKHLSEEAGKLSPEERMELMERIDLSLLSLEAEAGTAWDEEARRRPEAYHCGEVNAYTRREERATAGAPV
jgi:hypothetical protein